MPFSRKSRRCFLLLEVLIAMALVIFCAIPLIAPHVGMFKVQTKFLDKVHLDHAVNLLYVELLAQLYKNNPPWDSLLMHPNEIIKNTLELAGYKDELPYTGSYVLIEDKHKPAEIGPFNQYLLDLYYTFLPNEWLSAPLEVKQQHLISYHYKVFITRDMRTGGEQNQPTPQQGPQQGPQPTPQPTPPPLRP